MNNPLKSKGGIPRRIRNYFFTGLLVLIPLVLTGFIIWKLFLAVDSILRPFAHEYILGPLGLKLGGKQFPGIGFITLTVFIIVVGLVARNYFGKKIVAFGERIVERIPLINRVYGAIKQISEAFFSSKREVFKKPILFEYPRKGIYSIGFYTQDTRGVVQDALDDDVVSVFLPTTPNPTSGFLLFVPKSEIVELDLTIEEALKLVISGGAIVPKEGKAVRQPSLTQLEL
ncbi:DUF502 domain-containing protein [candidate division KSB1 bacterium]|nr:DUF502 domain-containing protein [candidate division KSB1 bacterium]NIR68985.1 DUF502 domain-containing protein [candidate division KSB1 bacterium]NIS22607.1 DUF502 domain-containing protein [candidate division KSB1 bacterium]NIT69467.1 DUF502 domain-containing protein [candidate division KSB1 bacterium]NIU23122.1 DUF502 domain-containing protein [candidate division KSB1 bacterium]